MEDHYQSIVEHSFTFPLDNGLHARPASLLAAEAMRFPAKITLTNLRSGACADATSVLELVSVGIMAGDPCLLSVVGETAVPACRAMRSFLERVLPGCDTPMAMPAVTASVELPRLLRESGNICFTCIAASPGIGFGDLVRMDRGSFGAGSVPVEDRSSVTELDRSAEMQRLHSAVATVDAALARTASETSSDILQATLALLRDKAFHDQLARSLDESGSSVAAVRGAVAHFSAQLAATGSAYLRERIVDVEDLGVQLLEQLGAATAAPVPQLTAPSLVVAPHLSAREFFALEQRWLRGLVLTDAGATSHAVILARSLGIPVVTGVAAGAAAGSAGNAAQAQPASDVAATGAVVDGTRGLFWPAAELAELRFYQREQAQQARRQARLAVASAQPVVTRDGWRIEVGANVASAAEVVRAVACGAEGVGLFRTELLFAASATAPTEDEQYAAYRSAVDALAGRPLIIRTLDIGGDKPLPYLLLPREDNPFLGYRGIRLYAAHVELLNAQIRAILRASAHGPIKLMVPMVSTVDEMRQFRAAVAAVQAQLAAEGIDHELNLPVGCMIETPAAALSIAALSPYCDFFSIGTNDLGQYFMAADRGNPQVTALLDAREPAFLRLLLHCTSEARRCGRWIGLCGELASQLNLLPLVLGLELDELSVGAPVIPALKAALAQRSVAKCRALLAVAATCATLAEVQALLELPPARARRPLLAADLIELDSDAQSKGEALKELADLAWADGRTDTSAELEDALWAREDTFSTGMGYGFAVPHCKAACVRSATLAVLRLKTPLDWGDAGDGAPVTNLVMLAMPEADAANLHLRIFARLARLLMDAGFREALAALPDAQSVVNYLTAQLELGGAGED